MPLHPIAVPMLNANEPEARLVQIHAPEGSLVKPGDLLFTIETTKAASEVEAPQGGYLRLLAAEGQTLAVGETLAYLADSAEDALPAPQITPPPAAPSNLRITKPAQALAEERGIALDSLPQDRLITEAFIRSLSASPQPAPVSSARIILYGAGGHAKAVLEMMQSLGVFEIAGIVDDNPSLHGTLVLGVPVLGGAESLPSLAAQGVRMAANGVGGIINIEVRARLFALLQQNGFSLPILRHPRAMVEASARLGEGVQVFANAYVGSSSLLHPRCMVNTGAVVSHDCEVGAYSHIAPGALLAGHVRVGERALVGMGVTTMIGLKIGDGARVGNGATLLADVAPRQIIPAGKVWAGGA